jgi:hypothetical protein
MKEEIKNCQNCKKDFKIEPDDFSFYEKIKVSPPTFCPECRFVRRMVWRNDRSLYKRNCDLCKKNIISTYDKDSVFPVYCPDCWKSDDWNPENYGRDYDFSRTFFEQWRDLFYEIPNCSLRQVGKCIDSEYTNFIEDVRNVYLSCSVIWGSEDVFYSNIVNNSSNVVDSFNISDSELLYENIGSVNNYNTKYSYWSSNCIDCNFILDCINCQNCFGCVNLRNKNYCIWNEQYSKEDYFNKIKDFNLGSNEFVRDSYKKFEKFSLKFPRKYARLINCISSIGDELRDCKNAQSTFNSYGSENVKFAYRLANAKNSMDVNYSAAELSYEFGFGGAANSTNIKFIIEGRPGLSEIEYSTACSSSSNLFGCIALKSKQYCILNKKYSKEEYFKMVEKIKQHMDDFPYIDKNGRLYKYGEFFPSELSPYGYNETVANEFNFLSKDEILKRGFSYKEKKENKYIITKKADDLLDDIKDVDDSILNEVIECAVTKKAFKITPFELQFYRRMNIPLPRIHQDERYNIRIALRNPLKLWRRICMREGCKNEFETSYAPERPEIVYCERCYQQEVY